MTLKSIGGRALKLRLKLPQIAITEDCLEPGMS
jgi:hypothetical protein